MSSWSKSDDLPNNKTAGKVRQGDRTQDCLLEMSPRIGPLINPPPKTRFQKRLQELQETIYDSRQTASCPELPDGLDPDKTTFGVKLLRSSNVGEILNPNKTSAQVEEEAQKGHKMQLRSHSSYSTGERVNRNYDLKSYRKDNRFGMVTPHRSDGQNTKKSLHWLANEEQGGSAQLASKRSDDFRQTSGKAPYPFRIRNNPRFRDDEMFVSPSPHHSDNQTYGIPSVRTDLAIPGVSNQTNYGKEGMAYELLLHSPFPQEERPIFSPRTKTEIGPLINPPPKTRFQKRLQELQETIYDSRQTASCPELPDGLDPDKTTFGVKLLRSSNVGEILNPNKTSAQVEEEAQKGHKMQLRSHSSYSTGERVNRNYDLKSSYDEMFVLPSPHHSDNQTYGVPSVRTDLAIPGVSNQTNYSKEGMAYGLLFPLPFPLEEKQFFAPRTKTEIWDIFQNAGWQISTLMFSDVWHLASGPHPDRIVSLKSFSDAFCKLNFN